MNNLDGKYLILMVFVEKIFMRTYRFYDYIINLIFNISHYVFRFNLN